MAYTDERAGVPSTAEGEQWHEAPGDGADGGTSPDQGGPGPAGKPRHALEGGRVYWEIARRLAKPEQFVTFVVVAAAVVFTFVQFEPSNLFRNTTISGGDTGAHVILPWIAEHQLLPNLRLTGWTSSNWDGFPAVTFYFPLPIYSIVALAKVVPYNVAFKLGTAAPMILMPVAGWLMGRLAKAPFPVPAVLAAATLPYMFGTEYSIYGGNIPSTLAGEFAFSWSLWFALVFLGLVMRGLPTGRYRALAAAMFACTFMSHIDPTMFATMGLIVLILLYGLRNRDWRGALWWAVPTVVVGGFIAAWWALPFEVRFPYVTNMGYTRNTDFLAGLFPMSNPNDTWLFVLAAVGAVLSLANRRRIGEFFAIMGVLAALAFRFMPQSILWNNRVLPFWFLSLYLLAGLAVAELYWLLAQRSTNYLVTLRAAMLPAPLVVLVLVLVWVGFPLRILPGEHAVANGDYEFLGIPQKSESYIPELDQLELQRVPGGVHVAGHRPRRGGVVRQDPVARVRGHRGRAREDLQDLRLRQPHVGVPVANEQLRHPGRTDHAALLDQRVHRLDGGPLLRGLGHDAVPFHRPVGAVPAAVRPHGRYPLRQRTGRGPRCPAPPDARGQVLHGPQHRAPATGRCRPVAQAHRHARALRDQLRRQYQRPDRHPAPVLEALPRPRFAPGAPPGQPARRHVRAQQLEPAEVPESDDHLVRQPDGLGRLPRLQWPRQLGQDPVLRAATPVVWPQQLVKPEPSTTVSNIVEHNASISFDVSRTGVPVVVTISYFPNWQVSGATGPYRVSPNLMVVVPTSHHVSLSYGTTPVDYEGWGLSILGLLGLVVLVRRPVAPVRAVRRTGMVRLPVWAVDASFVGDAVKGAWGREPSPPPPYEQMGPASHNGAAGAHFGASGHGNGATGEANGGAGRR